MNKIIYAVGPLNTALRELQDVKLGVEIELSDSMKNALDKFNLDKHSYKYVLLSSKSMYQTNGKSEEEIFQLFSKTVIENPSVRFGFIDENNVYQVLFKKTCQALPNIYYHSVKRMDMYIYHSMLKTFLTRDAERKENQQEVKQNISELNVKDIKEKEQPKSKFKLFNREKKKSIDMNKPEKSTLKLPKKVIEEETINTIQDNVEKAMEAEQVISKIEIIDTPKPEPEIVESAPTLEPVKQTKLKQPKGKNIKEKKKKEKKIKKQVEEQESNFDYTFDDNFKIEDIKGFERDYKNEVIAITQFKSCGATTVALSLCEVLGKEGLNVLYIESGGKSYSSYLNISDEDIISRDYTHTNLSTVDKPEDLNDYIGLVDNFSILRSEFTDRENHIDIITRNIYNWKKLYDVIVIDLTVEELIDNPLLMSIVTTKLIVLDDNKLNVFKTAIKAMKIYNTEKDVMLENILATSKIVFNKISNCFYEGDKLVDKKNVINYLVEMNEDLELLKGCDVVTYIPYCKEMNVYKNKYGNIVKESL